MEFSLKKSGKIDGHRCLVDGWYDSMNDGDLYMMQAAGHIPFGWSLVMWHNGRPVASMRKKGAPIFLRGLMDGRKFDMKL